MNHLHSKNILNFIKLIFAANPINLYHFKRQKKSKRIDGLQLCTSLWHPNNGTSLFYRLWPMGTTRYDLFSIINGNPLKLYNYGKMRRDFTYVDDVVEGIYKLLNYLSAQDYKWSDSDVPFRIFNIGNHKPVEMLEFIKVLEEMIGNKAVIDFYPMQASDF